MGSTYLGSLGPSGEASFQGREKNGKYAGAALPASWRMAFHVFRL